MSSHVLGHIVSHTVKKVKEEREKGRNKSATGIALMGTGAALLPFLGPLALVPMAAGFATAMCQGKEEPKQKK